MTEPPTITPGQTLGVLGGGQLGRMFAQAAQRMGYEVAVLDPDTDSPAGRIAEHHLCAPYTDLQALGTLAELCAAVTTEFENVPAASLRILADSLPVCPSAAAVEVAQNRNREKYFFRTCGVPTVEFAPVNDADALHAAAQSIGFPACLKTAQLSYDGKGQVRVASLSEAVEAYESLHGVECIWERLVPLQCEVSVIVARNARTDSVAFPVVENQHRDGILAVTLAPARIGRELADQAQAATQRIVQELNYQGVLAVEYFVSGDGELLANEMAPRPHNSGHYSIDACVLSQFEQQVRALCNLPLVEPAQHSPAVMMNLLGDLWRGDAAPDWSRALQIQGCSLHLYGKRQARPGRKMGHLTCTAAELAEALRNAELAYAALGGD